MIYNEASFCINHFLTTHFTWPRICTRTHRVSPLPLHGTTCSHEQYFVCFPSGKLWPTVPIATLPTLSLCGRDSIEVRGVVQRFRVWYYFTTDGTLCVHLWVCVSAGWWGGGDVNRTWTSMNTAPAKKQLFVWTLIMWCLKAKKRSHHPNHLAQLQPLYCWSRLHSLWAVCRQADLLR